MGALIQISLPYAAFFRTLISWNSDWADCNFREKIKFPPET